MHLHKCERWGDEEVEVERKKMWKTNFHRFAFHTPYYTQLQLFSILFFLNIFFSSPNKILWLHVHEEKKSFTCIFIHKYHFSLWNVNRQRVRSNDGKGKATSELLTCSFTVNYKISVVVVIYMFKTFVVFLVSYWSMVVAICH